MPRSLADCDVLIETRAVRLVRIHLKCRIPTPDQSYRNRIHIDRDRAMDLLIDAVQERDRAFEDHIRRMDEWKRRSEAAKRGHRAKRGR